MDIIKINKFSNIKIFLNLIAYFKKENKNLYQVLSEIYQSNGIFYFNSKKEKIDIYKQIEMNLDKITDYVLAYINKERDYE